MQKRLWARFLGAATVVNLATNLIPRIVKLKISVPDSVFLGVIITLFLFFGLLLSDLNKHETRESGKMEWPKLKPNAEILYVMALVIGEPSREMTRFWLTNLYGSAFKAKKSEDFNELVNKLEVRGYFDTSHIYPAQYCGITPEGISYYERYANRKHWKKILTELKRDKSSMPPTDSLESKV